MNDPSRNNKDNHEKCDGTTTQSQTSDPTPTISTADTPTSEEVTASANEERQGKYGDNDGDNPSSRKYVAKKTPSQGAEEEKAGFNQAIRFDYSVGDYTDKKCKQSLNRTLSGSLVSNKGNHQKLIDAHKPSDTTFAIPGMPSNGIANENEDKQLLTDQSANIHEQKLIPPTEPWHASNMSIDAEALMYNIVPKPEKIPASEPPQSNFRQNRQYFASSDNGTTCKGAGSINLEEPFSREGSDQRHDEESATVPGVVAVPGMNASRSIDDLMSLSFSHIGPSAPISVVATPVDEDPSVRAVLVDPNDEKKGDRKYCMALLGLFLLVATVVAVALPLVTNRDQNSNDHMITPGDHTNPTTAELKLLLTPISGSSALNNESSPQSHALRWAADGTNHPLNMNGTEAIIQRYVLAVLYFSTGGKHWWYQYEFLTSKHECEWNAPIQNKYGSYKGVGSCDSQAGVRLLMLADNNLRGTIPHEIAYLKGLTHLYMFNNSLYGSMPSTVGSLTLLEDLLLWGNELTGKIPKEMSKMRNIARLDLSENHLIGQISSGIGVLTRLEHLRLHTNELSGRVPEKVSNLASLRFLDLNTNLLDSTIPASMGMLTEMESLSLFGNNLKGSVPHSFVNLTSAGEIWLEDNDLTGNIAFLCAALSHANKDIYVDKAEVACSCCKCCTGEYKEIHTRVYTEPQKDTGSGELRCHRSCRHQSECWGATDGCDQCNGSFCYDPRPKASRPMCNKYCSTDSDCSGATDLCTACAGRYCYNPTFRRRRNMCHQPCEFDHDCSAAADGCTECYQLSCARPFVEKEDDSGDENDEGADDEEDKSSDYDVGDETPSPSFSSSFVATVSPSEPHADESMEDDSGEDDDEGADNEEDKGADDEEDEPSDYDAGDETPSPSLSSNFVPTASPSTPPKNEKGDAGDSYDSGVEEVFGPQTVFVAPNGYWIDENSTKIEGIAKEGVGDVIIKFDNYTECKIRSGNTTELIERPRTIKVQSYVEGKPYRAQYLDAKVIVKISRIPRSCVVA